MNNKLVKELTDTELAILKTEQQISQAVVKFKENLNSLQEKRIELYANVKQAMEKQNIKKFDNAFLTITYVAPTTRTSIDVTKLKEEQPEIASKYVKTSEVKSSIRIKVKEQLGE